MKVKDAFFRSKQSYTSHPLNSWAIGVICGLFISVVCLIDLVYPSLTLIFIPFLALPMVFACIMMHFGLHFDNQVTSKGIFHFVGLYFSRSFRSSFRVVFSFLKAILFNIAILVVLGLIMYFSFLGVNGATFSEGFNQLASAIQNTDLLSSDYIANIEAILSANNNLLYKFFFSIVIPTDCLTVVMFFYFASLSSLSIFARLALPDVNSNFVHAVMKNAVKKNRSSFYRCYFALNWPLYVCLLGGMTGGALITLNYIFDSATAVTIAVSSGFALASLFMPFYLNNMEAIYFLMEPEVKSSSVELSQQVLLNLQAQQKLTAEQAASIQEALDKIKKEQGDTSAHNPDDLGQQPGDEDKEKDPPEGPNE